LISAPVLASAGSYEDRYHDKARVIDATPIYETVVVDHPERHCWDEDVSYYEPGRQNYSGTVLGSIIGGVLVNQLHQGHGRGKDAATLAGALMGGAIGHDISQKQSNGHYVTHTKQRCEVEHVRTHEEHLVGYRVKYEYDGRIFTTRTQTRPGKWIPVRVGVTPVGDS